MAHNGIKAYNLLFLCNPHHQLSSVKDIVGYSLVFIVEYKLLKQSVKLLMVKYTCLLTYLLACLMCAVYGRNSVHFKGMLIWNNLPYFVKSSASVFEI